MTINNLRQMDAEEILKLVKTKICPKDSVRVGVVSDDFLDLAKTYYVDMDENHVEIIDKAFLDLTHLSAEQVKKAAAENMLSSKDVVLMDIESIMLSMYEATNLSDKPEAKDKDMLVLTNADQHYGASLLCNTELCDKIHNMIGDYYVLPSSVHEVILVKMSSDVEKNDLARIVRDVNSNVVAGKDYLSDNVYANVGNGLGIMQ